MENVSRTTLLAQAAPSPHLKSPRHRLDNTKRKGELSEAAFLLKAASLGFGVAKPWGDSERYDFILDPHDYKIHGQGAPPLSRSLRQSGDFDSPTLSSRAQSRDLVVSDAASNPGFGRGAPCLASFARRGNVTVAPALSRTLRQGRSFDFDGATSVPAGPKDSTDFASPTLSSRAKSRDLVFPAPRLWRVQLKWHRRPPYDVQPIYSIYGQGSASTPPTTSTSSSPTSSPSTSGTFCPSRHSLPAKACASTPTRPANVPASNTSAKPGTFCADLSTPVRDGACASVN